MKILGVLLAAGCSSRMGASNKLLLEYNNHTIIDEVLTQLLQSKLEKLFVVTGFEHKKIKGIVDSYESEKIKILYNENYKLGRASSIQCALNYAKNKAQALLFMVADKPMIKYSLIDQAINLFEKEDSDILYVQTPSGRGHPIIFSQKLFPDLLELEGDIIGNKIIEKYKAQAIVIENNSTQPDIDTYEDYLALIKTDI